MRLADVEQTFWESMRSQDAAKGKLALLVVGPNELSRAARVGVYHYAYWARQHGVLRDQYRRLLQHLGDATFSALMHEYLARHPSESPRIEGVGRHVAFFLGGHNDAAARACADLAAFEWAETEILLEPDSDTLATGLDVDPATFPLCRLSFVPALRVLAQRSDPLGAGQGSPGPHVTAVWRKGFRAFHRGLQADEHRAVQVARDNATIAEICDVFTDVADPGARALSVLRGWLVDGWISRIHAPLDETMR